VVNPDAPRIHDAGAVRGPTRRLNDPRAQTTRDATDRSRERRRPTSSRSRAFQRGTLRHALATGPSDIDARRAASTPTRVTGTP
jgi:hypothetical protein